VLCDFAVKLTQRADNSVLLYWARKD